MDPNGINPTDSRGGGREICCCRRSEDDWPFCSILLFAPVVVTEKREPLLLEIPSPTSSPTNVCLLKVFVQPVYYSMII